MGKQLVILAAIGFGVSVAWALWLKLRRKPGAMKMFARQMLRHPDLMQSVSDKLAIRRKAIVEAQTSPPPSANTIPLLIQELFSEDKLVQDVAEIHLNKAGARAEDALLKALDDPQCVWEGDSDNWKETCPAQRVAEALFDIPSRQLGDRIAHLVDHPNENVQSTALKAIALQGRAKRLPLVISGLKRAFPWEVEKGVDLAVAQGWAEPEFIEGVLAWAKQSILDSSQKHSSWAVEFFARHGGPEALQTLQSPEILSTENNRTIHFALGALTDRRVTIAPAVLRPLIAKSLEPAPRWPWMWVFKLALKALAVSDPQEAFRLAESHLRSPSPQHADEAIEFMRKELSLPEAWQSEFPPDERITPEDQQILQNMGMCGEVVGEVSNGGLSQYFFNSSGDRWPQAVEALKAIGYPEGAAALAEAARIIHPNGASLDRETRIKQYAQLSERVEEKLDGMSNLFYSSKSGMAVLQYMVRHKDLFLRVKHAREKAGTDREI